MIEHIHVKGYRLFKDFETSLQPGINVLIGANASGKSTFVELLRIMQSCCTSPIPPGLETRPLPGKVFHPDGEQSVTWGITVALSQSKDRRPIRRCYHSMEIEGPPAPAFIREEALSRLERTRRPGNHAPGEYPDELTGRLIPPGQPHRILYVRHREHGKALEGERPISLKPGPAESMLSRVTDPSFCDSWRFRERLLSWRFYSELRITRTAPVRWPQPVEGGTDLAEDGTNLSSVLLSLFTNMDYEEHREELLSFLSSAIPDFRTITPTIEPMTNRVVLQWVEHGLRAKLSGSDLSDGVLRLLILGVICLSPHPPTLICIDEPEIGLHPKLLPLVGGLLQRAAQRSQVIVLTHSPDLLYGMPLESIAVMRKRDGEAQIVWPKDHDILSDLLTEEVAGERQVDRERLRDAMVSGEMDELG